LLGHLGSINGQSMREIMLNVLNMLQPNRNTNQIFANSAMKLFLVGQLLMGGAGRMNDKCSRITDIGKMRRKFDRVDELLAGVYSALDAKGEHRPEAVLEVLLGLAV
jgi:hypothetical protein